MSSHNSAKLQIGVLSGIGVTGVSLTSQARAQVSLNEPEAAGRPKQGTASGFCD